MSGLLGLALIVAFLVWCVAPGRQRTHASEPVEPVDLDELEAAEREVRDLGVQQQPEEGFEGDDWGPGAGGRRS